MILFSVWFFIISTNKKSIYSYHN